MAKKLNLFSYLFKRRYGQRHFSELKVGQYFWLHGERWMRLTKDTGLRMGDRKIFEILPAIVVITRRS